MIHQHHLRSGDVILITLPQTNASPKAYLYGMILERHLPDMGDEDFLEIAWSDGKHCWKATSQEDKILAKCDLVATARE